MENVTIYVEDKYLVNIDKIILNLNRICRYIKFSKGKNPFKIKENSITHPYTFESINKKIISETKNDIVSILLTEKPYIDNYFYHDTGHRKILSFANWKLLTSLAMNNGLVYYIADLLSRKINNFYHRGKTTGCIYDFLGDKTGIDMGMRLGTICESCLKRIRQSNLSVKKQKILQDIQVILNDVSVSSRWNVDIVEYWDHLAVSNNADILEEASGKVFLSYDSENSEFVDKIYDEMESKEIDVWMDRRDICNGCDYLEAIDKALGTCKIFVFVTTTELLKNNKPTPRSELHRIFFRGIQENRNIALPVWVGVKTKDVKLYSLELSIKQAIKEKEPKKIADKIKLALNLI